MISNPTKSPRTAALYAETLTMPLEYQLARMTMLCEELERDAALYRLFVLRWCEGQGFLREDTREGNTDDEILKAVLQEFVTAIASQKEGV